MHHGPYKIVCSRRYCAPRMGSLILSSALHDRAAGVHGAAQSSGDYMPGTPSQVSSALISASPWNSSMSGKEL